ncbi:putative quinol monooxygenase [Cryptosporangium sp. NPDC051539]|uniref:putative quinol monooxygenase n=1 Tax=Cryptosporangium sp. NPDC051539 TaxID=3363962 RepID=UPI00379FED77
MIIVAGWIRVDAAERDRYLAAVADVTRQARAAPGCADFVQAPDPLDPERIVILERWESDDALLAFRNSGGPDLEVPEVRGAEVRKYRISAVEAP